MLHRNFQDPRASDHHWNSAQSCLRRVGVVSVIASSGKHMQVKKGLFYISKLIFTF